VRARANCSKSLGAYVRSGLARDARMLAFAVLLGLAVPLALLAAPQVVRGARDRLLVGGGWACFGGSFGIAIGAMILLAYGHRIAGLVGCAIAMWFAFAGLALAIEGGRRVL
jgi:hypothetical protein